VTPDQRPVVYSATWCGYCHRLKSQLDRAGIAYAQVDVDEDPSVLAKLEELNGGEWIIPTVEFADGSALVNPSVAAVAAKLEETA
jgi:mycoredoxin